MALGLALTVGLSTAVSLPLNSRHRLVPSQSSGHELEEEEYNYEYYEGNNAVIEEEIKVEDVVNDENEVEDDTEAASSPTAGPYSAEYLARLDNLYLPCCFCIKM